MSQYLLGAYVWSTVAAVGVLAPLALAAVSSAVASWRLRADEGDGLPPLSSQVGPISIA